MNNGKQTKYKNALDIVKKALDVRAEITDLYRQYRILSNAAKSAALIEHNDFKRAVDAIHYLGGGWPTPKSKGRMEALLDNFAGMYKVLDFIGKGDLVKDHLAKLGITINLDPAVKLDNTTLSKDDRKYLETQFSLKSFGIDNPKDISDLIYQLVMTADMIQGDICKLADTIKDGYRPQAMDELGVSDEEYDRLHDIMKFSRQPDDKSKNKATSKRAEVHQSIASYNEALTVVADVATAS